jgi:hypothetical protein
MKWADSMNKFICTHTKISVGTTIAAIQPQKKILVWGYEKSAGEIYIYTLSILYDVIFV